MPVTERLRSALADRYSIERELGAGGMATVYLARDLKHDREVALKVLRPDLNAMIGGERFLAEVRIAARLDHPHILTLIDSGSADGILYYVLPYVRGESLRAKLEREKQLGVEDALSIITQVASALDYAHAQGVVHRDIKPENILLHHGEAVLADFGIALAVKEASGERLTGTGLSLGTPQYMSPEQATGERSLDRRSDVYSLGAVFYEMIAGEPPVTGPTPQAVIAKLLTERPVKLRVVRETIPFAVERATEKALAKTPADRFGSAGEFVRALSVTAPEPEPSLRGSRIKRAVLAVAAVAVVGTGLWLARGSLSGGERDRSPAVAARDRPIDEKYVVAVLPFENLSADTTKAYFAAGMTEEITGQLSRLSALRVLSRGAVRPYRDAPDRLTRMANELGAGSVIEGSVRAEGQQVRIGVQVTDARSGQSIWSSQFDGDLSNVLALQGEAAKLIAGALRASLTPAEARRAGRPLTVNLDAYELYTRSLRMNGSNPSTNRAAIAMLRQAIGLDSMFARAFAQLGRRLMFLAYSSGRALTDSALVAAETAIRLDPDLADGYWARAAIQVDLGHVSAGRASFLKAIELDPSLAAAQNDLSVVENIAGRHDESLYWAARALRLDPNNPFTQGHVAAALYNLAADSAADRVLTATERRFPNHVRTQVMLAGSEMIQGRNLAAMERLRRVAARDPGDLEGPEMLAELAVLTHAPDAEALLEPLTHAAPDRRAQLLPETFGTLYAWTLARRGERDRADTLWNTALATARESVARNSEDFAPLLEIAAISAMRGDTAGALEGLDRGYQAGFKDYRILARDPLFDGVRAHPRFRQIAARMQTDVATMRQRAMVANPTLFQPVPSGPRP